MNCANLAGIHETRVIPIRIFRAVEKADTFSAEATALLSLVSDEDIEMH